MLFFIGNHTGIKLLRRRRKIIITPEVDNSLRPYISNPKYWQYKGQPVLLLGATDNDNLFQSPDMIKQLDLLAKNGGNYIRNTMSSRDSLDVWPFKMMDNAKV